MPRRNGEAAHGRNVSRERQFEFSRSQIPNLFFLGGFCPSRQWWARVRKGEKGGKSLSLDAEKWFRKKTREEGVNSP